MDGLITGSNTSDVIRRIAEVTHLTKHQAEYALKALVTIVRDAAVQRQAVKIRGLGVFEARDYGPRRSHSVRSGKIVDIPARVRLAFKPAKALRDI